MNQPTHGHRAQELVWRARVVHRAPVHQPATYRVRRNREHALRRDRVLRAPHRALGAHAPGAPRGHRSSRGGAWRWNWRCLGDPRRQPTVVPTFEEAADAVIAIHASTWKDGGKTEKRWLVSVNCSFRRRQLELPVFGARNAGSKILNSPVVVEPVGMWGTAQQLSTYPQAGRRARTRSPIAY